MKNPEKAKYNNFKQILNTFYDDEMNVANEPEKVVNNLYKKIQIVPRIIYNKQLEELKVTFELLKDKQYYKIGKLTEFYDRINTKSIYKYGTKLEFVHDEEVFTDESRKILKFIMKYAEIIKYVNNSSNASFRKYGRFLSEEDIILSNTALDELFEILEGRYIKIEKNYEEKEVMFVTDEPNITFEIEKTNEDEYKISPNINTYNTYDILKGKKYTYLLYGRKMYRCTKKYEDTVLKLLEIFRQNITNEMIFDEEYLKSFCSLVIPKLEEKINIKDDKKLNVDKYIPKKLAVKLYMDFDNREYITADVKFCYEDIEFNPLNIEENINVTRNIISETEALNIFRKTGFMFDKNNLRFILTSDDKIYNFLTDDINLYMQKFEVLVTDNFKTKQVKQPKIGSIGVKIDNNLLNIDLSLLDIEKEELIEILKLYKLKKKYYRLKDGSFFNLTDSEDIKFIDNLVSGMNISYDELKNNYIRVPIHRSLYLNKLLENLKNTKIDKDEEYNKIIEKVKNENAYKLPEEFQNVFREYQKFGFEWLKVLDEYNFGGILADDMGLGKTIQILSIILSYKNETEKKKRKTSIVVTPSSLALNWKSEIEKFASSLKAAVISGNLNERKEILEHVEDYDLIITSYELLKRDIEIYKDIDYEFRYVIADEAQYLKNSITQNAKSIKMLRAKTRYALTGTPIENSLSELWSIFDYIMPGYLFEYRNFKQNYEMPIVSENDQSAMEKLKLLIEPFVLRRTKKEVLKELPEKTVTVLNNEMVEEQEKIYMSYLAKAKQELDYELETNGFGKSRMKILALLTRLRQICCHPSLFIDNYKEESGKLNQCMEVVKDAISSGHRILLFSGYKSMFSIIEKELQKENIQYFKLTGDTKVADRVNLVEEFNNNDNIKIFLISLKAGGTGLNLVGADVVIHYDPWWNLSVENQATDRAYRIGQKNNVQVYKLITKNSIEEKIYELQNRKEALIDNMLSTETTFINRLSKDEIMQLFEK
mgnify:CR=1 FL=1